MRRKQQPTPVFWSGESMDRGAWQTTDHGATKHGTRLSDFHFQIMAVLIGSER